MGSFVTKLDGCEVYIKHTKHSIERCAERDVDNVQIGYGLSRFEEEILDLKDKSTFAVVVEDMFTFVANIWCDCECNIFIDIITVMSSYEMKYLPKVDNLFIA